MVKTGVRLLGFVLLFGAAVPAAAAGGQFDIRLGPAVLRGDSTYTIGGAFSDNQGNAGRYWDPISELKWPLDVAKVSLGGRAEIGRFSFRGEIAKNATSDAGDMEDSDWGVYYDMSGGYPAFSPYSKDVYSTSSTDLDALIVDFRGRYAVWRRPRFSTSVGLGLRYQKFSSVASDVHQYSPTFYTYGLEDVFGSDPFYYDGNGPAIDYEVTYTIPFAELSGVYRFGAKVSLEGAIGYSPLVQATDRDDHLLRFKLSEGSGNGSAWLFDLALRLQWTRHWFAALGVSGLFIDTSGTQEQRFYAGELAGYQATIEQTITSSQTSGTLEVGYSF
jgi:hypothetical protein